METIETLRKNHSLELSNASIKTEVNINLSLISSVLIRAKILLLDNPTNLALLDIVSHYDSLVETAIDDYVKLKKIMEELNDEKS